MALLTVNTYAKYALFNPTQQMNVFDLIGSRHHSLKEKSCPTHWARQSLSGLDDVHLLPLRSLLKVSSTLARASCEAASIPAATRSAARRVLSRASSATSRII